MSQNVAGLRTVFGGYVAGADGARSDMSVGDAGNGMAKVADITWVGPLPEQRPHRFRDVDVSTKDRAHEVAGQLVNILGSFA